jgi:hypothetical protein
MSATAKSITGDTTNPTKSTTKSESKQKEKTAEDATVTNVTKSQSQERAKQLRFPCSYCSRRFGTLEEVKRHIGYAHTPRRV